MLIRINVRKFKEIIDLISVYKKRRALTPPFVFIFKNNYFIKTILLVSVYLSVSSL